ncbi:hypothetical protein ACHAXR_013227 [Thalassiosira sp. AJA248-18]
MLAHPIAATAILLIGQSSAASTKKHPKIVKTDFMRAMTARQNKRRNRKLKGFQAELYGNSMKSAQLRKKIIEKATVVKPPGGGERKLNNNNGEYDDDAWMKDAQANYEYQAEYNAENKNYKYDANRDGTDDYYAAFGDWENSFGFDPTQFSLSYHRCVSVRQFDDEIAATEDTDSVFATKRFAVFRFCPEQTCMGFVEDDDYECDEDTYGETYCEYMEQYAENYKQYGSAAADCADGEDCSQQQQYMYGRYGQQEEEQELVGARGEGCQSNYGEYMMEMDYYLQLMQEYQEERFETYCQYCEECMYKVYEQWVKNGGGRKLSYEEFKNSEEHDEHRKLSNIPRELGGYYGACPEYDTCVEYQNVCGGGVEDEYSEYFECVEVQRNNGNVAYIGPHCAEDGFTITLGVFGDEYCNEYIGNGVSIANFIGEDMDIEEDALKGYYNSAHGATLDQLQFLNEENVCIPCRKGDLIWEEEGNQDDDGDNYNYDDDEINELCENLYKVSARCDKHYRSYSNKSKMAKYAEAVAQEDLTCDFIDSVVMGNYNEMGIVNLGDDYQVESQTGWMADNMYAQEYGHYVSEITGLQIFGLIFSILAVGILAVWSMTLHKSLTKTGPWRPRRGLRSNAPGAAGASPVEDDINRQNSGIVMGRSASNTSYYMS